MTQTRFTIDEDRLTIFLPALIAETDAPEDMDFEGLELEDNWEPRDVDEESNIDLLIQVAQRTGVIAAPKGVKLFFQDESSMDDSGFVWFVDVEFTPIGADPELGMSTVRLASFYESTHHLVPDGTVGAAAADAIIRDSVAAANDLLGKLDALVEARAAVSA